MRCAKAYAKFFNALLQVLCKLLAKGLANKTIHDIMHAGAWRGEAFLCIGGEVGLYLYMLYQHKLKSHMVHKNAALS